MSITTEATAPTTKATKTLRPTAQKDVVILSAVPRHMLISGEFAIAAGRELLAVAVQAGAAGFACEGQVAQTARLLEALLTGPIDGPPTAVLITDYCIRTDTRLQEHRPSYHEAAAPMKTLVGKILEAGPECGVQLILTDWGSDSVEYSLTAEQRHQVGRTMYADQAPKLQGRVLVVMPY